MRIYPPRSLRRGLVTGVVVAATSLTSWLGVVAPDAHADVVSRSSFALTRGVRLTKIRYSTPNEVRILAIQPQRRPDLDVVMAGDALAMYRLTSTMAAANDAVAGVNGDFMTRHGTPSHTTMIDGELWSSGSVGGQAFAISSSGKTAYAGKPVLKLRARRFGHDDILLTEWNVGNPKRDQVRAYTIRGGSAVNPPGSLHPTETDPKYCAVRLAPTAPMGWSGPRKAAITRNYTVVAQPEPCTRERLSISGTGNVVLAARLAASRADWIKRLDKDMTVKLSWGFSRWFGVTDVVGGSPLLVDNRRNVAPDYDGGPHGILWYNPRTAVGVNAGCGDRDGDTICKVWIVTVDGRQGSTGWSKGMLLPGLAKLFLDLGAEFAVGLDGGGSTTMWVRQRHDAYCESSPSVGGCLANRPSRSEGERLTINSLTVLPSADGNTPVRLR
jgi:hypothetical protein